MRPGRLLVDGPGDECVKIEKDKAIANAQHAYQINISHARNGLIGPDTCCERSASGDAMTSKAIDPKAKVPECVKIEKAKAIVDAHGLHQLAI
jgi:hypothetical protein